MKNIAVTGAGGFIGKNTVNYLQKNKEYNVFPVTREKLDLLDGRMVKNFLENNDINVVIHCANQGGNRGYHLDDATIVVNNLRMFFNIERCIVPGMKMINFGSGAQYDKLRDLIKVREDEFDASVPGDAYGYSKYVMSKFIKNHEKNIKRGKIYNPVVFGMYGAGEDYRYRFISNAIIKNLLRMPIVINQDVIFDYLYIEDYFRILDLIITEEWKSTEFNLTPTESISLKEIAEIINEIGNYKSSVVIKNEGMNYQYTGDNNLLMKEIGYNFSFTSYFEAITKMYQFYSDNMYNIDCLEVRKDGLLQFCKVRGE